MQGEVSYRLGKTVKLVDPFNKESSVFCQHNRDDDAIKLSPGGRYLFVRCCFEMGHTEAPEVLQIYDLHDKDTLAWTFRPDCRVIAFDFELNGDDTLLVAIVDRHRCRHGTSWCVINFFP